MLCLKVATDPAWVAEALRDPDALLLDHAYCEMKAASNALSLATRHPSNLTLVRALTDLAREEIDHFQTVLGMLERRGLVLGPPPVDAYAAELRKAAGTLPRVDGLSPLVDRLLVGALIEARSCERFKVLLDVFAARNETEMLTVYTELFAAEARHYRTFLDLAVEAAKGDAPLVTARLAALAELEAGIVRALAGGTERATVHG